MRLQGVQQALLVRPAFTISRSEDYISNAEQFTGLLVNDVIYLKSYEI